MSNCNSSSRGTATAAVGDSSSRERGQEGSGYTTGSGTLREIASQPAALTQVHTVKEIARQQT